jgi:hypothetical protein
MSSYTEIYEIQEHYRNHLEKVFYKLGKEKTSFVYREVLPLNMRVGQQMQMEQMEQEEEQNENEKSGSATQSANGTDKRNKQSTGNQSQSGSREQTR